MEGEAHSQLNAQAHRIAERWGYFSLIDYIAIHAKWQPSVHDAAVLMAHHENQSEEEMLVLNALCESGEIQCGAGYYRKDYIASDSIKNAIKARIAKKARDAEAKISNLAYKAFYYADSDYASLADYAAAELPWEKAESTNPPQFVIISDGLSESQHAVLETLKKQGSVIQPSAGYYSKDYIAVGELCAVLEQMHANVERAQTHVGRLRQTPPAERTK